MYLSDHRKEIKKVLQEAYKQHKSVSNHLRFPREIDKKIQDLFPKENKFLMNKLTLPCCF